MNHARTMWHAVTLKTKSKNFNCIPRRKLKVKFAIIIGKMKKLFFFLSFSFFVKTKKKQEEGVGGGGIDFSKVTKNKH